MSLRLSLEDLGKQRQINHCCYSNLRAAKQLGMETIREFITRWPDEINVRGCIPDLDVPIGGSLGAVKRLEEKLGIDLTSGVEPSQRTPSRL